MLQYTIKKLLKSVDKSSSDRLIDNIKKIQKPIITDITQRQLLKYRLLMYNKHITNVDGLNIVEATKPPYNMGQWCKSKHMKKR